MKIEFILLIALSLLLSACEHPEKIRLTTSNDDLSTRAVVHPERPNKDVTRDKLRSPETVSIVKGKIVRNNRSRSQSYDEDYCVQSNEVAAQNMEIVVETDFSYTLLTGIASHKHAC